MVATLTALNPGTIHPTGELVLTGTDFAAGAIVVYAAGVFAAVDAAPSVISPTEIRSIVPDLRQGNAGVAEVTVQNPSEAESNALTFMLNPWPPVETVYPLCTLSQYKTSIGVSPTETLDDNKLRELILHASTQVCEVIPDLSFTVSEATELYNGDGTNILRLNRRPVVSVSALTIDSQAVAPSELKVYKEFVAFEEASDDYNPRLRSTGRKFPAGRQNISVTYLAGYAKVPADLNRACIAQVSFLINTLTKQGVLNEGNNQVGVQTAYAQQPLCAEAKRAINRRRKGEVAVI